MLAETPDMTEDDWERLFAVNVTAVFHACKAAIPHMRATGGAIVNVASISGLLGDFGMGAYNASKAAVINYTRSLALDCSRLGIRVNALAPGAVDTDMMAANPEAAIDAMRSAAVMRRLADPDEMVGPGLFLLSDLSSFVTGSVLVADGGMTFH